MWARVCKCQGAVPACVNAKALSLAYVGCRYKWVRLGSRRGWLMGGLDAGDLVEAAEDGLGGEVGTDGLFSLS